MKKLIILFLIIGQILQAQDFIKPVRFLEKVNAYKYISAKDSVVLDFLNLRSKSTRPSNPRINELMNYNNSLQRYTGSTWVDLSLGDTTLLKAWIKLKVAEDTALFAYNSANAVNSDTALYSLIAASTINADTSGTLQGWDTAHINTLLDTKEPIITRSPGYLKWDGANWVWKNEAYLNLNDSSGFKLETKTSNAIKLGAKADTSLVNDTAYAIRQTVNTKLSTVSHDATLTGVGTASNVLKVDTTLIGTNKAIHDSVIFNLTGKKYPMGLWNASSNLYPSTNVIEGQYWTISTPGKLGGTDSVFVGDLIIAKINTPGQTTTNWIINSAASVGITVTGQKFNSSTKGSLYYNGRTPLAGAVHGGSAAPISNGDTLNINGLLVVKGNIFGGGAVSASRFPSTSYNSSILATTSYPSSIFNNSGYNVYPSSTNSGTRTRFGSSTISSTVWNTTPKAVSERHTYRNVVDVISGANPVSYLNFGYFKDAGTELIASRLGMTGDWQHLLGANTDYLTSYTGGSLSAPISGNKRTTPTTNGFYWYNYSGSAWTPIANLSNTGRMTLSGGLILPNDTLIIAGNDTVALKSDLVTLTGSQSIKIKGDSVAIGDTIFKTINFNAIDAYNVIMNTGGNDSHNIDISTTGNDSYNINANTSGDNSSNIELITYGNNASNIVLNTQGNGSMPIVVNTSKCDSLLYLMKGFNQVCRVTGQGYVITNVTDTLTNVDRVANMIHDSIYQHYDTLAATSTIITYNADVNPFRTDTIGENHTYHIDGAVNGSKGMLNVTLTSTATLTFPSGVLADGQSFSSLAAGVYNICWEKVQGTFNYNIKKYNSYTGY